MTCSAEVNQTYWESVTERLGESGWNPDLDRLWIWLGNCSVDRSG